MSYQLNLKEHFTSIRTFEFINRLIYDLSVTEFPVTNEITETPVTENPITQDEGKCSVYANEQYHGYLFTTRESDNRRFDIQGTTKIHNIRDK